MKRCQKQNLSACVVDEAEDTARHFTQDDLRQLFKFNMDTMCDTHDTFKCKRCKDGKQHIKAPALLYGDSSTWVSCFFFCFLFSSFRSLSDSPPPELSSVNDKTLMIDGIISQIQNWARCTMISSGPNWVYRKFHTYSNISLTRRVMSEVDGRDSEVVISSHIM